MTDPTTTGQTVTDYLLARLRREGVRHVFTVPGDYFGGFLDRLEETQDIARVSCASELEAGYAADAYARMRGLSCLAVQYGVGTLSAINAVAGAARERVPMLVLTGAPPAKARDALLPYGLVFHHSTDQRMEDDRRIFAQICAAAEVITSAEGAAATIDRVIDTALAASAPVYLQIWADAQAQPLPAAPAASTSRAPPADPLDVASCAAAADAAFALLSAARAPLVWAGLEVQRYRLGTAFHALVQAAGVPYVTSIQAKGLAGGQHPLCLGTYAGGASDTDLAQRVLDSDLVIALGVVPVDYYRGVVKADYARTIAALGGGVRVGHAEFRGVRLADFVAALRERIAAAAGFPRRADPLPQGAPHAAPEDDAALTYESIFAGLGRVLDREAAICCDLGIGMFMAAAMPIARDNGFVVQADWGAIGFAAPASLGAALAEDRPVVALCGDGGFQMVVQTLSTHVLQKTRATIVVLDNGTYGLEQAFMGTGLKAYEPVPDGYAAPITGYNVIPRWDYVAIAAAMGMAGEKARTVGEFKAAMLRASARRGPTLIQALLGERDMPQRVKDLVQSFR